jgi:hypothetical protein
VGKGDPVTVRAMLIMAEDGVLQFARLLIATLEENEALRQRMETFEWFERFELSDQRTPEHDRALTGQSEDVSAERSSRFEGCAAPH